ncbi:MupA/Atu3671 family FMN-dependent luciferase-like monooxygenase [Cognatishimia maritima]|uniref:Natural product biosynthesis luciferase-like monooxygenase domain-containing protein n=1 Tax=Cognatishimia maritima TaxID=870908 RepID=A0A1M5TV52_9RHOB|nr:MupA/Atu3671 family FMN-dependent luciferase-like monooxygenase [Cognatishimia maritima]SHH54579.1 natural product biosynthesis luciferase-like monooxygenase domain-containing protein [Cognatishimia maritima]
MNLDRADASSKRSAVLIGNESLLVQCAELWLQAGHEIAMIATRNPDILRWAKNAGHSVQETADRLADLVLPKGFDWLLSIANLDLIPDDLLARANLGAVNFHDGPLPRYAGLNAPVWARLNGETTHGVTWHLIESKVDAGDILVQRSFPVTEKDTALSLNAKCFEAAIDSFPEVITALSGDVLPRQAQVFEDRSYFGRTARPEAAGFLDFTKPSDALVALVRALDHGAYFNPLCVPKIRLNGKVLQVRKIEPRPEGGDAGTIVSADENALQVACANGSVTLSGLCDLSGDPFEIAASDALIGQKLSYPVDAAGLTKRMKSVASDDAAWRKDLSGFAPLRLPLVAAVKNLDGDTTDWQSLEIHGLKDLSMADRVAAVHLFAKLSGAEDGTQIAYRHAGLSIADCVLSPWVPMPLLATTEDDVATLRQNTEDALSTLHGRDTFALDLISRAPELSALQTPDLEVLPSAEKEPSKGVAVSVVFDTDRSCLRYDAARVTADHAILLKTRLEHILAELAKGQTSVRKLLSVPESERLALLKAAQGPTADIDPQATVHAAIAIQAQASPDVTALVFEDQALTYAELDARAGAWATKLIREGVEKGDIIGVHCRRSLDLVVACLAIWKAGAAYLPLDPSFPQDRLSIYLEDSAAKLVVSQSEIAKDLPTSAARVLLIDAEAPPDEVATPAEQVTGADLAYLMFTSGSTGRPKGVMVEHSNVINFFAGMDDRVQADASATWMAVTSLSFDISVLELFYTLSRGHKVVLSGDEKATQLSDGPLRGRASGMEFSLYYWGNDDGAGRDKYRLLLEGAQFADENGFCAVWTPERHFHAFGGPYPNPSVTGAAVAGTTRNIGVRAGSCVAPLHHTARIAEEWSVIDNLTNGRAGLAIASGWQPDDFVLRPENTPPANKEVMFQQIADLRKLWRGEAVEFPRADGQMHAVVTQPRPVSKEPDIWVTTAGNPETWKEAGRNGAHILTHLLGQSISEVADKIKLYHAALREAGHRPEDFKVTLMLHSFIAEDRETARDIAREPMKDYLRSAAGLIKQYAWAFPAFKKPEGVNNPFELDLGSLSDDEMDGILDFAFQRYFEDSGLFGTVDDCIARADELKRIGVTEIACLIDYGIDTDVVLEGLRPLTEVVAACQGEVTVDPSDMSIAGQIMRHGVTHMQCTPSMARMFCMNDEASMALRQLDHLFLGGEALPAGLVAQLAERTDAKITNMYGPTETTIWSTTAPVTGADAIANIGTPITNTTTHVVDDNLQPVPFGVAGELLIGGDGVTRGYLGREDLTQDRFVPDDLSGQPAGQGRLYRTGDLVRRRLDGVLDFIGRVDHQVKIRGYRIELGEIERRIEDLEGISQAVVIVREDTPGDVRLVAYHKGPVAEDLMRSHLAAHLPSYMVPSRFVRVAEFPLTPNKKIDRKALPAPKERRAESAPQPSAAPVGAEGAAVMPQIAALWSRILGVNNISAGDNFFDLGGHSLLAVQAHRDMRDTLGFKQVSITDIFRFPTLGALSARIEAICGLEVGTAKQTNTLQAEAAAGQTPTQASPDQAKSRQSTMAKRRMMRARRREKIS